MFKKTSLLLLISTPFAAHADNTGCPASLFCQETQGIYKCIGSRSEDYSANWIPLTQTPEGHPEMLYYVFSNTAWQPTSKEFNIAVCNYYDFNHITSGVSMTRPLTAPLIYPTPNSSWSINPEKTFATCSNGLTNNNCFYTTVKPWK